MDKLHVGDSVSVKVDYVQEYQTFKVNIPTGTIGTVMWAEDTGFGPVCRVRFGIAEGATIEIVVVGDTVIRKEVVDE